MKHLVQRYAKEKAKEILWKMSSLFCTPLSREDTRKLDFLEQVSKTSSFELSSVTVSGKTLSLNFLHYPETTLFRAKNPETQSLYILPSGGVCNKNKILCTGFDGHQAYNVLGYLQSLLKSKKSISGTIVCNWPQQFLTYGDFVIQLLPELCLIKSVISQEEWLNANFIFPKPPKFLIDYLKLLGCNESQVIDSSNHCFEVVPESLVYFREKDPMWFLCGPIGLLQISRKYLMSEQEIDTDIDKGEKILFIERFGGYRNAIGLDKDMRSSLRELGVAFFDPTRVSVKKQIETFSSAQIVIGIHGAGLANILWCQQGTKVVEISHPEFAPWCYAILANHLNMDYYSLNRDPGSMDINFRESDVDVDWQCLIELIKKLKNNIS
jgi:hypothetical protein